MPIYAYRCTACGHAKDVLQKMSDRLLSTCPACGAEAFTKQVTAAGFQLKGSGWYATDFKGSGAAPAAAVVPKPGDAAPAPAAGDSKTDSKSDSKTDNKSDSSTTAKSEGQAASKPANKADGASPAAAAAPAGGSAAGH